MTSFPAHAARWLAAVAIVGAAAAPVLGQTASPGTLPAEPPAMRASLEKTVFGVDVLDAELRFDEATTTRIARLAEGPGDRDVKADAIARAAFEAERVVASLRFERRAPLSRFVAAVRDDMEKAERAGMIDARTRAFVSENLPSWFAAIEDRGFREGDRLTYRADPEKVRTTVVDAEGRVLLDQTDRGAIRKRILLAGYFAPGATLRAALVDSALE